MTVFCRKDSLHLLCTVRQLRSWLREVRAGAAAGTKKGAGPGGNAAPGRPLFVDWLAAQLTP